MRKCKEKIEVWHRVIRNAEQDILKKPYHFTYRNVWEKVFYRVWFVYDYFIEQHSSDEKST